MATIIDRAVLMLIARGVPHRVDDRGDTIHVPAADTSGFDVSLQILGDRAFLVQCDGWRHDFDRGEDAYDCFEYVLSDSARLKVIYRGEAVEVWQLEKREFGMWTPGHPVRRRSWAFWRARRVEYRQNRVFNSANARPGRS
jgi:hypothetical protein